MPRPRTKIKVIRPKDLLQFDRWACFKVLDAYTQIREVIGQPQCLDYSRNTGGQGAQYDPLKKSRVNEAIDFKVDVENATEFVLGRKFAEKLLNNPDEWVEATIHTEEMLGFQQTLGQVFKERGLYPVQRYFEVIKR